MALTRVMRSAGSPPEGSQAGGITGVGKAVALSGMDFRV